MAGARKSYIFNIRSSRLARSMPPWPTILIIAKNWIGILSNDLTEQHSYNKHFLYLH